MVWHEEENMPHDWLEMIDRIDPAMVKRLHEQDEFVYADGVLPRKLKLLIAMAFDASHGVVEGARALAKQAKAAGATDQEMSEILRVAYHLSGIGAIYAASAALREPE
jgi:alkylhydroperoxidase/carboxymuconolactone decarboxylase family protein YurZ